jgi:hypothetical protein
VQPLAEAGAAELEHQLAVVIEPEREDVLELLQRLFPTAELEEHFAEPGERVLVIGVERDRRLERARGPREFFAGQVRIGEADVELDRVGIEGETFAKQGQCFVVAGFVVELVGLLIIVVGAQEGL